MSEELLREIEGRVAVAVVHNGGHHTVSFSHSLLALYQLDPRVAWSPPIQVRCGTNGLVEARNSIMAHFLDKTEASWLFMIDDDMGFRPDIIDRLLEAAMTPELRTLVAGSPHGIYIPPVVGALCFGLARDRHMTDLGGYACRPFPTLYDWAMVKHEDGLEEPGFKVRPSYEPNTLTRVAGTGAAALLVHRHAAERVRTVACEGRPEWFERARYASGTIVSEDLSFCYRLNAVNVPIFVHTGVQTSHMKTVWVDEDYFLHDLAARMAAETMGEVTNGRDSRGGETPREAGRDSADSGDDRPKRPFTIAVPGADNASDGG